MPNVLVTPENAALWGFDRIGQTINTDTGGIVNPFEGPADGFTGRASRNAAIAARGPGNVAPGYSQIMSDPANVAFNQRLLGDSQFAWDNLKQGFDRQVDGNNPMLFYGGGGSGAVSAVQRRPSYTPPGTGVTTTPGTTPGGTAIPTTPTTPATPPATDPPDTTPKTPATGPEQGSFNPTPANTNGGLFAIAPQSTFGASTPNVQRTGAEYNPRDGVVNAMTKQFKAKSWF